MSVHLDNIKKLIDQSVLKGVFANAESVAMMLNSYQYVAAIVEEWERLQKLKEISG